MWTGLAGSSSSFRLSSAMWMSTVLVCTSEQNRQAERLRDVIVGTDVEAAHDVGLGAARRQHEHGHFVPLVAQRAQHAVAIEQRQTEIEHDEVRLEVARPREPRHA